MFRILTLGFFLVLAVFGTSTCAQDKSVNPGINDTFKNPSPKEFQEKFEVESREVFSRRQAIIDAIGVEPGQTIADVGAGTGIFTRLFAKAVGPDGHVIAVDIAKNFLEHIDRVNRELDIRNVDTLLCNADSTELPKESIDLAFICDTYHHFEYPAKTMTSIFEALKPDGRVVLVDFRRIPGESTDWTLKHVRAGQEVFEAEIIANGFVKVGEDKDLLKENYLVIFAKKANATP